MKQLMVLLVLLTLGFPAVAQKDVKPGFWEKQGLTQDEQAAVKKSYADLKAKTTPLLAELKVQKALLGRALVAAVPNKDEYTTVLKKIAELETSLRLLKIESGLNLKKALGADKWLSLKRALAKDKPKAKPLPSKKP